MTNEAHGAGEQSDADLDQLSFLAVRGAEGAPSNATHRLFTQQFLLGTTVFIYAQHEERGQEQGRTRQGEQHRRGRRTRVDGAASAGRPNARASRPSQPPAASPPRRRFAAAQQHPPLASPPTHGPPQQSYGSAYHGGVQCNGPTYAGVHHSGVPQHQGQVRGGFGQSRADSWDDDHRTWGQRGGYNGYRVPETASGTYFGRDHFFRINGLPLLFVGGSPRFQYDGYWVTFLIRGRNRGPDWYETDDVYLDDSDGYYLYDRNHPGTGIAVTLAF